MKMYIAPKQMIMVGKAWEIKAKLKYYSKEKIYLKEILPQANEIQSYKLHIVK